MLRVSLRLFTCVLIFSSTAISADWPTSRHDSKRSGRTEESLIAENLQEQWVISTSPVPQPAWPGPAKWDAYAHIRGLMSMRDYDVAYPMAIVGQALFYSSSADDSVHCVDTRTGRKRWSFTTDAPIRLAPTIQDGRVYFGSDDGHAYCINATDGQLVWKSESIDQEKLILNNGRFISRSPCRTGVLVENGTAYFGLSLLPWRQSYLVAVAAETGKVEGEGRFVRTLSDQTLEGGILISDETLVVLRGRVAPYLFNRNDGRPIGGLKDGGGGAFATLNQQGDLFHGPGNKTGWITQSSLETRQQLEKFDRQIGVVALEDRNLFLSDVGLSATSIPANKTLWNRPIQKPIDLIVAGETAIVGVDGEVIAVRSTDGKELWRAKVNGRVHELAVADQRLFVSTDEGAIHCFQQGTRPAQQTAQRDDQQSSTLPEPAESLETNFPPPQGVVGHWRFRSGAGDRARRRGVAEPERYVENSSGTLSGVIAGNVQYREVGGVEGLEFDGQRNSVLITDDHSKAGLPTEAISAEAWVRIDTPIRWGGIVGAIQDNGAYERGWLLGYENSQFSFAIASEGGSGKLTYMRGKTEFEPHIWYHVVGTYDGTTQKLYVNGKLEATSTTQHGPINEPPQAFLELGAYHDKDEYYRMTGMLHEVLIYKRALTAEEIAENHARKDGKFFVPIRLAKGPFASFTETDQATIKWSTAKPSPTILELTGHGNKQTFRDETPKTEHTATLTNLQRNRVGQYMIHMEIDGKPGVTQEFQLDSGFNYSQPNLTGQPDFSTTTSTKSKDRATELLKDLGQAKGICLVLGITDGNLAYELARQSKLNVICVDTNRERIEQLRERFMEANVYGTRLCARHVDSFSDLPFVSRFANLIASERPLSEEALLTDAEEMYRVLRPFGGLAKIEWNISKKKEASKTSLVNWASDKSSDYEVSETKNQMSLKLVRPELEGAGEWSHLYGRADNSAFGGETLAGASSVGELEVHWVGRPGPRAQPDRSGRKPSPLSKNGRLFVQGMHRLIGVDAYNGTILWSLEIPQLERFNMPRDCGNWCADDDFVYVAVRNDCWKIDAQTGDVVQTFSVLDGNRDEWTYDWSYVARVEDELLGSAVKQGTAFTNFWGSADAGWYDARSGAATFKVCSENLYSLNPKTGQRNWMYENGLIINPTITATDEFIYFVECRNSKVKVSSSRRVGMPELWKDQYLVALETQTGKLAWEELIDTADGIVVFNMAKGGDRLVLSSSNNKQYNVYAFDSQNGEQLWEQKFGWLGGKGDHGKAMSRPAIVGETVYVRPQTLSLKTGEILPLTMPGGGCGTYAATTNALFFRSGNVTAWNSLSGSTTSWDRLRPGCWLSTIPASGMLLSPEAGGGCSCGSWLETSLGFMPKEAD